MTPMNARMSLVLLSAALAAASNQLRWSRSFGPAMRFGDPVLSADQALLAVFVSNTTYTGIAVLHTSDGGLLWQQQVHSAMQAQSGWVSYGEAALDGMLYAGTSTGVLCLELQTGRLVWTHTVRNSANASWHGVPAHATLLAGRVFFTFEAGVNSSQMMVLNASTGAELWRTKERVVTLIWPVRAAGGVGYCGWDVAADDIGCTVRSLDGAVLWAKRNLTYTDPGLWDNPNLVVDYKGNHTYMFSKPEAELRCVTAFDSISGRELWFLPSEGDVDDYDTFAWDGQYFRLTTVLGSNDTAMQVQMRDGGSGEVAWSSTFKTVDSNAILLVGGGSVSEDGFVVVFGMSENHLFGFDAATGAQLWTYGNTSSPTTGTLDKEGWLYFGDGTGEYRAISARG